MSHLQGCAVISSHSHISMVVPCLGSCCTPEKWRVWRCAVCSKLTLKKTCSYQKQKDEILPRCLFATMQLLQKFSHPYPNIHKHTPPHYHWHALVKKKECESWFFSEIQQMDQWDVFGMVSVTRKPRPSLKEGNVLAQFQILGSFTFSVLFLHKNAMVFAWKWMKAN